MSANFKSVVIEDVLKAEQVEANGTFLTNEGIEVKSVYNEADIKDVKHTKDVAGIAPNTRGPYPTMYVARPWTVRQYAGTKVDRKSVV